MNVERKVHGPHILLKTVLETLFSSQIEGEKPLGTLIKLNLFHLNLPLSFYYLSI